ncbi:MAG: AraC family transcriptional regulator [Spirochaetales bacterium]|nr:MAG: AraC family transcriptional regulator [Spirochaetales bacterium]
MNGRWGPATSTIPSPPAFSAPTMPASWTSSSRRHRSSSKTPSFAKKRTVPRRPPRPTRPPWENGTPPAPSPIEKNFNRDITRGEIAREIGVSTDYLGKVFKDRTGKCIRDYISDTRVKWALDQLLNTDRKIIDIAFDAGFDSLRTFNRAFSRVMGDSPTKYRNT